MQRSGPTEGATPSLKTALHRATAALNRLSDSPELDAGLLLAHVLDKPHSYLFGHPDDPLPAEPRSRFETLIARRRAGEPVAYLIGSRGFWTLDLAVSEAVLVPRPETETLVETALARLPADAGARVADLGTGSGAVALALASERPAWRVVATDSADAALAVARDNAARLGLTHVEFRAGDWYAPLAGERFDLLVSNPPYVAEDDSHLADLAHEPRAALVAKDNGLACLRRLVEGAPAHLAPGGWLLLEHGHEQDYFVRRMMTRAGLLDVATEPDLGGRPRVTFGRKP